MKKYEMIYKVKSGDNKKHSCYIYADNLDEAFYVAFKNTHLTIISINEMEGEEIEIN